MFTGFFSGKKMWGNINQMLILGPWVPIAYTVDAQPPETICTCPSLPCVLFGFTGPLRALYIWNPKALMESKCNTPLKSLSQHKNLYHPNFPYRGGEFFFAKGHMDIYDIMQGPHKISSLKINLLYIYWILSSTCDYVGRLGRPIEFMNFMQLMH